MSSDLVRWTCWHDSTPTQDRGIELAGALYVVSRLPTGAFLPFHPFKPFVVQVRPQLSKPNPPYRPSMCLKANDYLTVVSCLACADTLASLLLFFDHLSAFFCPPSHTTPFSFTSLDGCRALRNFFISSNYERSHLCPRFLPRRREWGD